MYIIDRLKMRYDDGVFEFNFKFSQCYSLDESIKVSSDISTGDRRKNKKKQQQLTLSNTTREKNLCDLEIYDEKLSAFCGVWEDCPRHHYRMDFCIEKGQLVGYSNILNGKALTSYDGHLINMIIVHPKESDRPIDHYRGRLGWNGKYIVWEKEDSSRETGWRPTRRWIKIE